MDTSWLIELDPRYYELDEKPQFGASAPFPLEELKKSLRQLFQREDLEILINEKGWEKEGALFNGIGEQILPLTLFFSPLKEPIYFITSEQDLSLLMNELLLGSSAAIPFSNPSYIQGFYQFLSLEIISNLEKLQFAEGLNLRLGENPPSLSALLEKQNVFTIDVTCKLNGVSLHGRLLLTNAFRNMWKQHFIKNYKVDFSSLREKKIPIEVSVVGGFSLLSLQEWKDVKEGDLILLDRALLESKKVALQVDGKSIFRGKVQENGIKLLGYPLYHEVLKSMDENENENEDENEDEFFAEEEDEEIGFEGIDEEISLEEGETFEEHEAAIEEAQEAAPTPLESVSSEKVAIESLNLTLSIEVGRIKMTLDELMKLDSGNLLDIKIQPEQGVSLVINDKKVGRGELVKIGDVIGVRVIEL